MKIAFLTTDGRELLKQYDTPAPRFGTAPEALLQGFALLPELEVHVVSCLRQEAPSPPKLAPNIFYHSHPKQDSSATPWTRRAWRQRLNRFWRIHQPPRRLPGKLGSVRSSVFIPKWLPNSTSRFTRRS